LSENQSIMPDYYVNTLAQTKKRKYAFQSQNLSEFEKWQHGFREHLLHILGIHHIASRNVGDLDPVQLNEIHLNDHIREEWKITSEPGYQITFFVIRPLNQEGPLPVVITPHGHGKGKKYSAGVGEDEEERKKIEAGMFFL
jgi:hypothetical protein